MRKIQAKKKKIDESFMNTTVPNFKKRDVMNLKKSQVDQTIFRGEKQ